MYFSKLKQRRNRPRSAGHAGNEREVLKRAKRILKRPDYALRQSPHLVF